MQNDDIEKFNGHVNWLHKLTPYKLRYKCSDDCLIQGCPSHVAEFTINHAVDTFTIDWGNGEKIRLDGVQMGMIKDFMERFGDLSTSK